MILLHALVTICSDLRVLCPMGDICCIMAGHTIQVQVSVRIVRAQGGHRHYLLSQIQTDNNSRQLFVMVTHRSQLFIRVLDLSPLGKV